jgi:acetyl-CoA acetyltransferase
MPGSTVISGAAEVSIPAGAEYSLEALIYESAKAALEDAGRERDDLDGIVIAASDQVDGRAISSMLTSGPAGAYLNDEINTASSPGHAFALAVAQIAAGTHRRVLVGSWGKASETASGSTLAAEHLSAEPFFERDIDVTPLSAAGMQAQCHRASGPQAERACHEVAARSHAAEGLSAQDVAASPLLAYPLRVLEWPSELDGSFALILERAESAVRGVHVSGVGWCSDSGRLADRDLVGLPHLHRAAEDARRRAGLGTADTIDTWHLHDYSPDAELLAYEPLGLCAGGEAAEIVLAGETAVGGRTPVSPGGGSLAGEAPFGGPLRKVVQAVRQLRGDAGEQQVSGAQRALVQMSSGFAGQFQTIALLSRGESM